MSDALKDASKESRYFARSLVSNITNCFLANATMRHVSEEANKTVRDSSLAYSPAWDFAAKGIGYAGYGVAVGGGLGGVGILMWGLSKLRGK